MSGRGKEKPKGTKSKSCSSRAGVKFPTCHIHRFLRYIWLLCWNIYQQKYLLNGLAGNTVHKWDNNKKQNYSPSAHLQL